MYIYLHTLYEWVQHNTHTHESLSFSHDKKIDFTRPNAIRKAQIE